MERGRRIPPERIDRIDPGTGALVRQITSARTRSVHMHYETPTFDPAATRMIFAAARDSTRRSPLDLMAARTDGTEMVKLSGDDPAGMSGACLGADGVHAYYLESGTLHRTRLDDASDEQLGHVDDAEAGGAYRGACSFDGRYCFNLVGRGDGEALVRWDLSTGEQQVAMEGRGFGDLASNPGGPEITFSRVAEPSEPGESDQVAVTLHCDTLEPMPGPGDLFDRGVYGMAHGSWLGRTGRYQGTLKWPGRGVQIMDRGGARPNVIATGPHFWHSSASLDGEWIVADTNAADEGIWLISVPTRRKERLCYAGASNADWEHTHPRPSLSDDGRMAAFTSDATGVPQVYVVSVPDEMRARMTGDL